MKIKIEDKFKFYCYLALMCLPLVTCDSRFHEEDVKLTPGTQYETTYYADGSIEAIGEKKIKWRPYYDAFGGLGAAIANEPVVFSIRNGDELYNEYSDYIGRISMKRNGNIRLYGISSSHLRAKIQGTWRKR